MSSGAGRTPAANSGHVGHVDVARWRLYDVVVMTHPVKDGAYARLALFLELRYGTRQSALIDNRARTSPAESKNTNGTHRPPPPLHVCTPPIAAHVHAEIRTGGVVRHLATQGSRASADET